MRSPSDECGRGGRLVECIVVCVLLFPLCSVSRVTLMPEGTYEMTLRLQQSLRWALSEAHIRTSRDPQDQAGEPKVILQRYSR